MSNKFKEIDIKNRTKYFFDDMSNKTILDSNKIKIYEKSHKNILIYYAGYLVVKSLSYIKINSVNLSYSIISKINGYIEESNENKYLILVLTDERKDTPNNYEKLWNKIRDFIISTTNKPENYDEKYMKIKLNSDDALPLKKTLQLYNMAIVVRSVFHEERKYYPQVLDEFLYKL